MEQPKLETIKIASYILHYYDRNSHKDHIVLAKYLEKWAIEFCERPSNTQIQMDAFWVCDDCNFINVGKALNCFKCEAGCR